MEKKAKIPNEVVTLAKMCLEVTSNLTEKINPSNFISHQKIMEVISTFLKEQYGADFYNQIMNILYQSEEVKISLGTTNQIDSLESELMLLNYQKTKGQIDNAFFLKARNNLVRKIYRKQKESLINTSYVQIDYQEREKDIKTGLIYLDLKETLEDAFTILHECMHRIYMPYSKKIESAYDEVPSMGIEWQFFKYCQDHELYQKEACQYMLTNLQYIKMISTEILLKNVVLELQNSYSKVTNTCIRKTIQSIENPIIREILLKEYRENLFLILEDEELDLDCSTFINYLQSYYIGYLISQKKNASNLLKTFGHKMYVEQNNILEEIKGVVEDKENLKKYQRELKRILKISR